MKVRFEFKFADLWIGAYWAHIDSILHVWVCVLPCFPLHIVLPLQGGKQAPVQQTYRWDNVSLTEGHIIWAKLLPVQLVTTPLPEGWHCWDVDAQNKQGVPWCTRCQTYHRTPTIAQVEESSQ